MVTIYLVSDTQSVPVVAHEMLGKFSNLKPARLL